MRAARPAGRDLAVRRDAEAQPGADSGPRKQARWFSRKSAATVLITVLAVGAAVTVTPAEGAAGDIASSFAQVVRQLVSTSQNGKAFAGTPAVGALFTTSHGRLGRHFCTASVVHSPAGDLVVTAAHCVSGTSGLVFAPGYNRGGAPYGMWAVTRIYTDRSWKASSDPEDDVAFLRVSQSGSTVPIEDVTGAERLETGMPARQLVEVIGYPDATNEPIACRNWTREPMSDQLEFDCGGYTDGTSGAPFLAEVNPVTGQGTVIGVIGGYEQGGLTPQVSYSSMFRANVAALYRLAEDGG